MLEIFWEDNIVSGKTKTIVTQYGKKKGRKYGVLG